MALQFTTLICFAMNFQNFKAKYSNDPKTGPVIFWSPIQIMFLGFCHLKRRHK